MVLSRALYRLLIVYKHVISLQDIADILSTRGNNHLVTRKRDLDCQTNSPYESKEMYGKQCGEYVF